uniref:Uncharacterized protein n=1 Tax=Oreochromis niloticus TaxID=8128 RepID=A0A669C2Q9_ORENI
MPVSTQLSPAPVQSTLVGAVVALQAPAPAHVSIGVSTESPPPRRPLLPVQLAAHSVSAAGWPGVPAWHPAASPLPTPRLLEGPRSPSSPTPRLLEGPRSPSSPTPRLLEGPRSPSSPTPRQLEGPRSPSSPTPRQLEGPRSPSSPTPRQLEGPRSPSSPTPRQLEGPRSPSSNLPRLSEQPVRLPALSGPAKPRPGPGPAKPRHWPLSRPSAGRHCCHERPPEPLRHCLPRGRPPEHINCGLLCCRPPGRPPDGRLYRSLCPRPPGRPPELMDCVLLCYGPPGRPPDLCLDFCHVLWCFPVSCFCFLFWALRPGPRRPPGSVVRFLVWGCLEPAL